MYKEDLLEILNQLRYINKDMKLDKANNKTPFLEAIERKIKEQPLVNEKTGMKYTNMNELMISSFKILEELYNDFIIKLLCFLPEDLFDHQLQ